MYTSLEMYTTRLVIEILLMRFKVNWWFYRLTFVFCCWGFLSTLWWVDKQGKMYVLHECTHSPLFVYMQRCTHTCVSFLYNNTCATHSQRPIVPFEFKNSDNLWSLLILSLCFCFPFPCLGKKLNANRNSGIQRKTHSLRLRKQEQGIFGKRRDACVQRVRMCASLFGKKKSGCIVHVTLLRTRLRARACARLLLCVSYVLICWLRGHFSVGHRFPLDQTAANSPLWQTELDS